MSLEVHIFASEEEANNFLEPYLQKNETNLLQMEKRQQDFSPLELCCPMILNAENKGYSFYGGVRDPIEITGYNFETPTELAAGIRKALLTYTHIIPNAILRPLFLTINEVLLPTLEEAVEQTKEAINTLPLEQREQYYKEIGGEENLENEVKEYLSSRGLTESEVQEFKREYQKVPKGLD